MQQMFGYTLVFCRHGWLWTDDQAVGFTCAVHHGNRDCVGASYQEATVVDHLVVKLLIPVGCNHKNRSTLTQFTDILYMTLLLGYFDPLLGQTQLLG